MSSRTIQIIEAHDRILLKQSHDVFYLNQRSALQWGKDGLQWGGPATAMEFCNLHT